MEQPKQAHEDPVQEPCAYCGALCEPADALTCPRCGRPGCPACMPAGNGAYCPDCESVDADA